jgi:hypothetical protein
MSKSFGVVKKTSKRTAKISDEETLATINDKLEALGFSKPSKPKYEKQLPNGQVIIEISQTNTKNCHCFWCKQNMDWQSIGCPIGFNKESNKYVVEGQYCSINCIVAFVYDQSSVKYRDSLIYLCELYYKIKKEPLFVKPALDWKCLTTFNGPISVEIFRKDLNLFHQTEIDCYNTLVIPSVTNYIVK